jgi:hypothetical protein
MAKIKKFYLNKASYFAIDENGNRIDIEINYWENRLFVSKNNSMVKTFAKKLLGKKHRVNFVYKMLE